MAIFKSRKEKFEARIAEVEAMSKEDYEAYKSTNFARKKKIATGWLIGSAVATGVLLAMLGITGAIWGWAIYRLAFALTVTLVGGSISAGLSGFFRRHYKRELRVQRAVKEKEQAKTIRGRSIDTQKQTQLDNVIAKNVQKLQNARQITPREASDYRGGSPKVAEKSKMDKPQKTKAIQEYFQNEVTRIKTKRDTLSFKIDTDLQDFKNNEISGYKCDDSIKGKIEVLFHDYDENGQIVLNSAGSPVFKPLISVSSESDIELSQANAVVHKNLAEQEIDFPVIVKVTVGGESKQEVYNSKEELEADREVVCKDTETYLNEHKQTGPIPQPEHQP